MAALGTLARGGRREDIANDVCGEGGTKIAAIELVYMYRRQELSNNKKRLKVRVEGYGHWHKSTRRTTRPLEIVDEFSEPWRR